MLSKTKTRKNTEFISDCFSSPTEVSGCDNPQPNTSNAVYAAVKPRPRKRPFAEDARVRNLHHRRRFFEGKTRKITKFDDSRLRFVVFRELVERKIQIQQRFVHLHRNRVGVVKRNLDPIALHRVTPAGVIDENPPHGLRGDRKKLSSILPVDRTLSGEFHICLVNERGRRKRFGIFVPQKITRDAPKFVVNDRQEFVESFLPAVAEILQESRNFLGHKNLFVSEKF